MKNSSKVATSDCKGVVVEQSHTCRHQRFIKEAVTDKSVSTMNVL
jgi:hypothetical protein